MNPSDQGSHAESAIRHTEDDIVNCRMADFEELSAQVLKAGHDLRFRARGSSMRPMVRDGDILIVRRADDTEIAVGDIVFYRSHRKGMVVHRVVGVQKDMREGILVVKGDAVGSPDPAVCESQVWGKVVSIERSGRPIDPDSRLWRYFGALYVHFPPVRWWVYPAIRRANRALRRLAAAMGHML